MRKILCRSSTAIGFALLPHTVRAAQLEEVQSIIGEMPTYALIVFAVIVAIYVTFKRLQDERRAPVAKLFNEGEAIHSVGPEALVTECVRTMTSKKIGALIVIEGERLIGIFTERDALNKVLAAGRDPRSTKVSEVMTKDPYCISPTITVREAMELVTKQRFRHLPIVRDDKVLAVLSSGDLTHWLVKGQIGEVQELVDLAARS